MKNANRADARKALVPFAPRRRIVNPLPPLSHGYVHEPYSGAWQANAECKGFNDLTAFSAVYACASGIAQDIAKLALKLMRNLPDGSAEDVTKNHPLLVILRKPNGYQTLVQFLEYWLLSKMLRGNAFILKFYDMRNVVAQMHVLNPNNVKLLVNDEDGEIFYEFTGNHAWINPIYADSVVIPSRYIMHDRMAPLYHPLVGVSPIFAAAASASTGISIGENSETFFRNMSRTSGVLSSPNPIKDATAKRIKETWEQATSGQALGKVVVLGDGLEWQALSLSAADSQLIEQLRWTVEDVARAFRYPSFLLGNNNTATYKNSEQMMRSYYNSCLAYHIQSLEAVLDDGLGLLGTEYNVEVDLTDLFRLETDSRYTTYQTALNAGFMSINQARRAERWAPVEGGDEPRVQMQYVPLSQASQQQASATQTVPTAPGADDDEADDDPPQPSAEEAEAAAAKAMQELFDSIELGCVREPLFEQVQ